MPMCAEEVSWWVTRTST